MSSAFKKTIRGKKSKYYYGSYLDHNGKRITKSTGCTDKQSANRIVKKWESESQLVKEGVVDLGQVKLKEAANLDLEEHIQTFKDKMLASKCSQQHINEVISRIKRVCNHCKYSSITQIDVDGVNRFVSFLAKQNTSAETMGKYIGSMKSLTKWLVETNKLARNPLLSLKKPNPNKDRRLERRMLLLEEWNYMKANLIRSVKRFKMTPENRLLLYETALQTGYRANELRKLTKGALEQIKGKSALVLRTSDTKNAKRSVQYISEDLAERIKRHTRTLKKSDSLFNMPSKFDTSQMIEADLKELRTLWMEETQLKDEMRSTSDFLNRENNRGEIADFHSLRHTCGAWLAMSGVHPKVIQTVMRHSNISLTMDTYGHLFPQQEADAVISLWKSINES